jgi:hypothetical protein
MEYNKGEFKSEVVCIKIIESLFLKTIGDLCMIIGASRAQKQKQT